MKNTFLKSSCLILLVVVAFVYFANPIYAKASTADMDYVETDMTTSEVAELFAVPAAFLPAALVIIGFIVLTYCTLRNIQVPVSYPSQASFLDKCTQLGQYVVDNITDPIKDFLYSVYTYCEDNNLTSITGIAAFTALHIGKFFHAIAQWINGSLINNVSSTGQGLLQQFSNYTYPTFTLSSYAFSNFDDYSLYPLATMFSAVLTSWRYPNEYSLSAFHLLGTSTSGSVFVLFDNGFCIYDLVGGQLVPSSKNFISFGIFNSYSPSNVVYSTSSYTFGGSYYNQSYQFDSRSFYWTSGSPVYIGLDYLTLVNSLGFTEKYVYNGSLTTPVTISPSDVQLLNDVVTTPWSDQIYQPSDDELELDPDGVGEALGGAVAGLTLGELINLLTQGKTLTLDSALESQKIVGGGDYVFPSMDGIWKYPQYFYDMLKGWGSFVGGCLSAVTVGDGGLSWIFYGGFVLLICGGIIGKILLG